MPASTHMLKDLIWAILWAGEAEILVNQHLYHLTVLEAGIRSLASTVDLPHQHTCNHKYPFIGSMKVYMLSSISNFQTHITFPVKLPLGEYQKTSLLTHWGRVTHICVGKETSIGSDNGLSPSRRQAIIWTNAGILLIGPLGTNFSEISIEIHILAFKKMHLKTSSGKWRPFCLGLNVLIGQHGFR